VLTIQGWLVVITAVLMVAAGRLFGIVELYVLGAGAAALAVGALVTVARARLRLSVDRELHPPRVHAGSPSRVELHVANRAKRRTPMLTLRDPVGEGRSATVVVAPLPPEGDVRATYRLPTERRGILRVGPLSVQVTDPFGLASVSAMAAAQVELTVWPAIDDVPPVPHTTGDDPHGGTDHPNALTSAGEDFYALRAYVMGDDLRHVHWRSTARRDELMVRQDEMPWQGRVTIVLDTRAAAHSEVTFEQAVSAAASIVVACGRRRYLLRLVTTGGHDTGTGAGTAHLDQLLEILATVTLDRDGDLGRTAAALRRARGGGSLTVLLGDAGDEQHAVASLRRSFLHATVLSFQQGDDRPFPERWRVALRTRPGAVLR
jgi:uncharacterized protein (DUF58 family)